MKLRATVVCLLLGLASLRAGDAPGVFAGDKLPRAAETFEIAGDKGFLYAAPKPAVGRPWVWFAPTIKGVSLAGRKMYFDGLLNAGISIAGFDLGEVRGAPASTAKFTLFYDEMVRRGWSPKPILLGQSRGGLMTLAWAMRHPDKVCAWVGVYPVCNLTSYPMKNKEATLADYALTEAEFVARLKEFNPVDNLQGLLANKVPMFVVHGDSDTLVPYDENTRILKERYEAGGGRITVKIIRGEGHKATPSFFECRELLEFVTSVTSVSLQPEPLQPVLQSFVDKKIAPGVVALVANKDRVLALDKAGYASLANKTPIRDDAVFWIASMSKSLTGTALMMLVDEGRVSLDDPVEKYLPEFKGQMVGGPDGKDAPHPPKHPITVREIMSHTSGLVLASEKTMKRTQVLKEDVLEYAKHPLRQEPGTKYEYNNCGINAGGRIIEVVSGMSYAEFMQKRLFDPLGMKDTTCWPNEEQAARLAHTARFTGDKKDIVEIEQDKNVKPEHILKFSGGVPVPKAVTGDMGFGMAFDYGKRYAMPAGGYFSTVRDLGRFCRMLLRGGELDGRRYLSEKAVRTMSASQTCGVKVSPQESYGVGWSVKLTGEEGPAPGSFGHRGARRTAMWVDPKNELAMVILVERFDMTGPEQKEMYGSFMKAAVEKYGKAR